MKNRKMQMERRNFLCFCAQGLAVAMVSSTALAADKKSFSITDDRGVTIEVPAHPQRIAAIS